MSQLLSLHEKLIFGGFFIVWALGVRLIWLNWTQSSPKEMSDRFFEWRREQEPLDGTVKDWIVGSDDNRRPARSGTMSRMDVVIVWTAFIGLIVSMLYMRWMQD
jgi:hypothetical protein